MMAALFVWAGVSLNMTGATIATALAAAFSMVGIVLARRQGGQFRDLPQGWLFVPVAVLGGIGLIL
jgi:Flp pilus assembly protein protease CpaA